MMGLGSTKQSKQACLYNLSEPEQSENSYSRVAMSEVVQRLGTTPGLECVTER